jgi:hypothetical protein
MICFNNAAVKNNEKHSLLFLSYKNFNASKETDKVTRKNIRYEKVRKNNFSTG